MVLIYRRFNWPEFSVYLYQTAKASTMVMIIMAGAACFAGIFLGMGGGKAVVEAVTSIGLEVGAFLCDDFAYYFGMLC